MMDLGKKVSGGLLGRGNVLRSSIDLWVGNGDSVLGLGLLYIVVVYVPDFQGIRNCIILPFWTHIIGIYIKNNDCFYQ